MNLNWSQIDSSSHATLYTHFEEDKVKLVIFSFENSKALGSNGFPIQFYKCSGKL